MNTNSHEWRHAQVGFRAETQSMVFNAIVMAIVFGFRSVDSCLFVSIRGVRRFAVWTDAPESSR